jgi:cell division protein FtsL
MSIEVVFEKRINNATVYRTVDVAQRRQYFLLTFLSAVFVFGLLLYGWQQYRWFRLGYDIMEATARKEKLLEYQRQLVLQKDTLAQPARIDGLARNTLGMVVAAPGQIVSVTREELEGPEGAAAPLSASSEAK